MQRFTVGKLVFILLFFLVCSAFRGERNYRTIINRSFSSGEYLEYRVHYGFINAGEAIIKTEPKIHILNNRACYKIEVSGKTVGAFDMAHKVRDTWGTYMDTASLIPHKSYRVIREGKYRKDEIVNFFPQNDVAEEHTYDKEKHKYIKSGEFAVPQNVQDLVGGYLFLRTVDYKGLTEGDQIEIPAFFEGKVYQFKVIYKGKETLKTNFGERQAILLLPVIPDSKLFKGKNAVSIWLSDDQYKIPLKIKADLVLGSLEMDLRKYEGLRK